MSSFVSLTISVLAVIFVSTSVGHVQSSWLLYEPHRSVHKRARMVNIVLHDIRILQL